MTNVYSLVTGASEGLGRGFAQALAKDGRNLVVVARNRERLQQLKDELQASHGIDVVIVCQDLAEPGAAEAVRSVTDGLAIDCLINNAGFQVPMGAIAESDLPALRNMIAVNVVALNEMTCLFLPKIVAQGGTIVNVASHAAFQPVPYMAAYAASKSYVLHFTEALRSELADSNPGRVHVMVLCPGATQTKFWERSASPVDKTRFPVMSVEAVVAVAMEAMKHRRKTVVIPSIPLRLSTQILRIGTRSLNIFVAKKLVGH